MTDDVPGLEPGVAHDAEAARPSSPNATSSTVWCWRPLATALRLLARLSRIAARRRPQRVELELDGT
ncbi:MAG TPA: hypothetical protein VIW29_13480, partial [Polyangiaceae bacterium]